MKADDTVASAFFAHQPVAAARLLETMNPAEVQVALAAVPAADAALVLRQMLPSVAADCIGAFPVAKIQEFLQFLPSQAGAALLRHFDAGLRTAVLDSLGGTRAAALGLLLRYPRSAVGAWMEPKALVLLSDLNMRDARARLKAADGSGERIYLLDLARKVRGVISGLALLQGASARRLESIADDVDTLWARTPLAVARKEPAWEQETELPVVNRQDEFIGVITQRELRRGLQAPEQTDGIATSGTELNEVFDVFLSGLRGSWQSLAEVLEPEHIEQRDEK